MKASILYALIGLSTATSAFAGSGSATDKQSLQIASLVRSVVFPKVEIALSGDANSSDIFGNLDQNVCEILPEDVDVSGSNFLAKASCGLTYDVDVTGNIGDGDLGISSINIKRR